MRPPPAVWQRPTGEEDTVATDEMLLSFSSGTTGYPKMIRHDFTYPLGHILTGVFWHRVEEGRPALHNFGHRVAQVALGQAVRAVVGESAVFVYDFDRFDGADILSKIAKYKVTTFCAPPTMYRMMLQNDVTAFDLSSLRHCCTAGEAMNPEIYRQWKEETGLKIFEGFGQTETTACVTTLYPWISQSRAPWGFPPPATTSSCSRPDGEVCPPGVTGEICIRAESLEKRPRGLFIGYYHNEEDTAAQWHDGWYHTGDTAYRDGARIFLVCRSKRRHH